MKNTLPAIAIAALLATALPASAHITLEQQEAQAGTYYKAVLRVGHGCAGSPIREITVRLPAGVQGAKPMPKAGWTLFIQRSKLALPYQDHGKPITEDVSEITWRADGPQHYLANAHYGEFSLRGRLPQSSGPLWFKVLQVCAEGQIEWAQVPPAGTSTQGLATPAALLQVRGSTQPHSHH